MDVNDHGIDESGTYAAEALRRMRALGVPSTPANFEIWYSYVARASTELVKAMDVMTSNREPFTRARLAEIHALYFSSGECEAQRLTDLSDQLEDLLVDANREVAAAGQGAEAMGGRVTEIACQAAAAAESGAGGTAATFTRLVRELAGEAREAARRSREQGRALDRKRRALESMRGSLEEMRTAAETDALTGLPNRRAMERRLREGAMEAMEVGGELCVAMADVDHFKQFNDTHGHLMGDHVLRLVAKVMRGALREGDTVARYGGEEFAVIMPGASPKEAVAVAERIRRSLTGRKLFNRQTEESLGEVTMSIGVASYEYGESMEKLVRRADESLYEAKRAGRDRVKLAPETGNGLAVA